MEVLTRFVQTFKVEILLVLFIIIYILNIFSGRAVNRGLGNVWKKHLELLQTQFSSLSLTRESYSVYSIYGSGRKFGISYLEGKLVLFPRHDLIFGSSLFNAFFKIEDYVEFTVTFDKNLPFVLALLKPSNFAALKKERYDLKTFTSPVKSLPAALVNNFSVLADNAGSELSKFILNDVFLQNFVGVKLDEMIISDQPAEDPVKVEKHMTKLFLRFKSLDNLEFVLYLIYLLSDLTIEPNVLERSNKQRAIANDLIMKEVVRLQTIKLQEEKLKREKEEKKTPRFITREQAKKEEAKKERQEAKKKGKKLVKIKKF